MTEQEHLQNMLTRLEQAGLCLNRAKSAFMLPSIQYLGQVISTEGIQPSKEKVRALLKAPAPTNTPHLRSFLGAVNYYKKFLPNLTSVLTPLNYLLQKDVRWTWGKEQKTAFNVAKQQLTSTRVLAHYDLEYSLVMLLHMK